VILLDNGGMFPFPYPSQKRVAEIALEAMNLMPYTAMNLGWSDISAGTDFLKDSASKMKFPFISSNAVYKETGLPLGEKYLIREAGGIKIGILGILPVTVPEKATQAPSCGDKKQSDDTSKLEISYNNLTIIPPEEALKQLLPEVRAKADAVILLSQCGFDATGQLVNQIKGIDLAITGPGGKPKSEQKTGVPVLQTSLGGKEAGFVKLTLNDSGQITQTEKKISLHDGIASQPEIAKITGDDIVKKLRDEEVKRMEEETKALLKLSPFEYYKKLETEKESGVKK
jgi:2',3'-cyclic-nucleotide 2'-phosphodiesterase (5'-nucleotidase family)